MHGSVYAARFLSYGIVIIYEALNIAFDWPMPPVLPPDCHTAKDLVPFAL